MKCSKCRSPAEPNRKVCRKHLDYAATQRRKQYAIHKAAGRCSGCNKPARTGRTTCGVCGKRAVVYARQAKIRWIASGLCVCCTNPVVPGMTRCQKHREKSWWHHYCLGGCGIDLRGTWKKYCDTCRDTHKRTWLKTYNSDVWKRRLNKTQLITCSRCMKNPAIIGPCGGRTRCAKCLEYAKLKQRTYVDKRRNHSARAS